MRGVRAEEILDVERRWRSGYLDIASRGAVFDRSKYVTIHSKLRQPRLVQSNGVDVRVEHHW